ncbi:hypothetical protein Dimus_012629 [Dionaea muscipula]
MSAHSKKKKKKKNKNGIHIAMEAAELAATIEHSLADLAEHSTLLPCSMRNLRRNRSLLGIFISTGSRGDDSEWLGCHCSICSP